MAIQVYGLSNFDVRRQDDSLHSLTASTLNLYQQAQFHGKLIKPPIKQTKLTIYECEGTESEIKQWFRTINIAGIQLNDQELLNAIFSGPFVTLGNEEFSNSQNSNIQKWSAYIQGSANRQVFLECALDWVSKGNISDYMSWHRFDTNIAELRTYFNSVIKWISGVFKDVESEMRGLEWGRMYEAYHKKALILPKCRKRCKS
jgi:hypothetical protein